MKLSIIGILVILILTPFTMADDYVIDSSHTFINFRIKHLGVSYAYGRFNDVSGKFSFSPNGNNNSITIVAKTASIDTGHKKRDKHLRGSDFFSAKRYPNITFTSTSFKKSGQVYEVTGKLSLHGITKKITVKAHHIGSKRDPWGGYRCGFETSFTIKRSDFGMRYMLKKNLLSDKVNLTISVEGKRK